MILIDENTGEAKYVVLTKGTIASAKPLGRLTLSEVRKMVEVAGNRPPIDSDAMRHETLVRRIAGLLPHRDMRTIRKYLRGETIKNETLLAELESAKAHAEHVEP